MSGLFKLDVRDLIKGLVMAVLTAVIGYVQTAMTGGTVDVQQLLNYAVAAGLAYLAKNLSSDENGKLLGKI